jgi:hypothetical protein
MELSLNPTDQDFKAALDEVKKKGKKDKQEYNFVVRPDSNGLALPVTQSDFQEYLVTGEYGQRLEEIEAENQEKAFIDDLPFLESEADVRNLLSCLNGLKIV